MYPIWIIVLNENNHYVLGIDKQGSYYHQNKARDYTGKVLTFKNEDDANDYIYLKGLNNRYHAEVSWRASNWVCPNCGAQIEKKANWNDTIIGECVNPECKINWEFKDGETKRYFFG